MKKKYHCHCPRQLLMRRQLLREVPRHRCLVLIVLAGLAVFTTISGCHETSPSVQSVRQGTVEGVITYRHWLSLPADAELYIRLLDISRPDSPAVIISERFIDDSQQLPVPFVIYYNTSEIDPRHTYAVQAQIRQGDRLLFANEQVVPVITQGHPSRVEVPLDPVFSPRTKQ